MDRAAETSLIDRTLRMDAGDLPEGYDDVHEWPVAAYLDPDRFQRELAILQRQPVPLAHVSQLPQPGDFRVETVGGRSILLTHSRTGRYRALLNVCRHRGAEVVRDAQGSGARAFRCPYHAWTYDTDGCLTAVPDAARSFPGLDRPARGLTELPLEVRHGLLWVTLTGPPTPVAEFLGPDLDADLAGCGLTRFTVQEEGSQRRAFNWKTGAESFMESYHFAVLHRETAGRVFLHNTGAFDRLGRHFRTLAPKKTLREQPSISGGATIMYLIFPATVLFVEKDHLNLLVLHPEAVDRCRVVRTHLVARRSPRLAEYWAANIGLFLGAVEEDLDICESMQRGYASGANTVVTFGRNEAGCHAYRTVVEQVLDAG